MTRGGLHSLIYKLICSFNCYIYFYTLFKYKCYSKYTFNFTIYTFNIKIYKNKKIW